MKSMAILLYVLFLYLSTKERGVFATERGIQIRLTRKVMDYALDLEIAKLKEDLQTKSFDQSGKDGRVSWSVSNARVTELSMPSKSLSPIQDQGIKVSISNAYIRMNGRVGYRYKKGCIRIRHHIDVTVKARNIRFDMMVNFGKDSKGSPTIHAIGCSSDLDIDVDFHGGASWIYNIFSGIFERKLKKKLRNEICESAVKVINKNAQRELATFPVIKKIDDWAIIDYRMVADPVYTTQYMDVLLKGEFKEAINPKPSTIPLNTFTTSMEQSSRMFYIWLSDYTANTAGETYHNSGRLQIDINGWDSKTKESDGKKFLNTEFLKDYVIIYKMYRYLPIGMHISSFKAPRIEIKPTGIRLFIYARVLFRVKGFYNNIIDLFGINFSINASLSVTVKDNKIIPQVEKYPLFKFRAEIDAPYIDAIVVYLNNRFVYGMLYQIIIIRVNEKLSNGYDIPNMGDVTLNNFDIKLQNNAIRIGSDATVKE